MNPFIINNRKGQTLIETAVVLLILLIIVLGLAEFARAWFLKSSLKNAVRQGARVAVVITPATGLSPTSFQCTSTTACPNTNVIINAVCCQPGVKSGTSVTLQCISQAGGSVN